MCAKRKGESSFGDEIPEAFVQEKENKIAEVGDVKSSFCGGQAYQTIPRKLRRLTNSESDTYFQTFTFKGCLHSYSAPDDPRSDR